MVCSHDVRRVLQLSIGRYVALFNEVRRATVPFLLHVVPGGGHDRW